MLKNEFHKIVSTNDFSAEVVFVETSAIFAAHFPEKPVVPGACLVKMAEEIFSILKNKKMKIEEIFWLKFLKIIDPTMPISIKFSEENDEKVKVLIFYKDKIYVKMSLKFMCNNTDF